MSCQSSACAMFQRLPILLCGRKSCPLWLNSCIRCRRRPMLLHFRYSWLRTIAICIYIRLPKKLQCFSGCWCDTPDGTREMDAYRISVWRIRTKTSGTDFECKFVNVCVTWCEAMAVISVGQTIQVPSNVDLSKIVSVYMNGILCIALPCMSIEHRKVSTFSWI